MKLNIGSGSKRYPGYLNVDIDADSHPDFIVDLEKDVYPFDDNSVDSVLAHHVLEHMGDGFFHCMKELYRVCQDGATIHVRVPHPRHDTFLIDPTHKRPIYPHTLDMFSKTRNKRDLDAGGCETPIGFINDVDIFVESYNFELDGYWKPKFQQMTEEECEHVARSMSNVILEIEMTLRVVKNNSVKR